MSVLRLIPKVRQTAAFVAPPSSAATTAAIFSASIATGRPPCRPRRRAAARPARTRSWVRERSNCASAPKTWKRNSPCGVVVSICSVSERNATPRSFSSFIVASRWDSDRPRRSSFHTTRQSPGLRKASAFPRPARSSPLPLARSPLPPAGRHAANPGPGDHRRSKRACSRPACVRKSLVDRFPHTMPFRLGLSCIF